MHFIRKLMDNPFVLVFVAGIYPAVFLMSNNWFVYSKQDFSILLTVTVVTVLSIAAVGYALVTIIRFFICSFVTTLRRDEIKLAVRNTFFTLYTCFILFFLLQSINASLIPNPFILWAIICAFSLCLVILAIKKGIRMFTSFVSFLLVFSICQFGYSYFSNINRFHDHVWYTKNKDHNKKIIFRHRPNVYLVVLEAYHNTSTLKEIYHYDNQDMEDKLAKFGFQIHDAFYANYNTTLTSIAALFTMEHHFYKIAGGNSDSFNARHIIGGKSYNPVVSIFRNNGYKIQYISHSDYCYLASNVIDYAFPKRTIFKVFELYQINLLDNFFSHFFLTYRSKHKKRDRIGVNLRLAHNTMVDRIRFASQSDKPYFTFIKLGLPDHFGESWERIDPLNSWYPDKIKEANNLILRLADEILKNDLNPLIIIVGDHGAYRYRRAWTGKFSIHRNLAQKKISEKSVANDLYSVFFAIRYPEHDISIFKIKSTVNLMRYVFSFLSDSELPLETKAADESYFKYNKKIYISVREGKPLNRWEFFK